ncbi:tetrahydrofolate dehydrogenase/cyclohydrolase catalytic domain-containing protein [Streptomyces sp. NPDC005393]|uniref:tetrahydrofolate dehydrogenase/cyclohydrolase catalytic domain-containing protein n=1 Tax=Streptomyces sp. NPDC005393 TaxID=3157041 RepID=UPI0033BEE60D
MASQEVSGRALLRQARELYAGYHEQVEPTGKRVAIIRFEPAPDDPPEWAARLEASKVSAEQKVKSFEHLGFIADHVVMPHDATRQDFAEALNRFNTDAKTAAIIVQFPPPAHMRPVVDDMDPAKDIDGLLKECSPYRACATAEGIYRVVEPYAQDNPSIAVVGSRGFVGQGVVTMLKENGIQPIELDAGDDLTRVRDADIVVSVTGNPGIIGREHLQEHHRLVVDSGFVPQPDGSVMGDIRRDAYDIPQNITPVPGGIGPVEMATLMERVTRQEVDPHVTPWRAQAQHYQTREQLGQAQTASAVPEQARGHGPQGQYRGEGQGAAAQQGVSPQNQPIKAAASMKSAKGNAAGQGSAQQANTAGQRSAGTAQRVTPPRPPQQPGGGPSR